MSRSRFNRIHRGDDVGRDRLSTFQMGNVREINTSIPRRRVRGARQTQKLVFRKLVSVINNELSIYFTRDASPVPSVYSDARSDGKRGILSQSSALPIFNFVIVREKIPISSSNYYKIITNMLKNAFIFRCIYELNMPWFLFCSF